jgi:hypothetical protein
MKLAQHRAEEWVAVDIKWDAIEEFKAIIPGKPIRLQAPERRPKWTNMAQQ